MTNVAFIGLGVMGYHMAGHLTKAGHAVTVYNRTQNKAERWVGEFPGKMAATPAEAAKGAEFVFACVGRDSDVREVTIGPEGAFQNMAPDTVFVDHTTASADVARELSEIAAAHGCGFIDAPVSGGEKGAVDGCLTIMCGGSEHDYARAEPVMAAYARQVRRMGDAGAGQLTKMVNQICLAGLIEALSEGLHFAKAAGVDPAAVIDVISKGAAQSWQMENRYKTMLAGEYEHGFAVEWMRKDLGICLDQAKKLGLDLPVTDLVNQYYGDVEKLGGRRWDTSSLLARLDARAKDKC